MDPYASLPEPSHAPKDGGSSEEPAPKRRRVDRTLKVSPGKGLLKDTSAPKPPGSEHGPSVSFGKAEPSVAGRAVAEPLPSGTVELVVGKLKAAVRKPDKIPKAFKILRNTLQSAKWA